MKNLFNTIFSLGIHIAGYSYTINQTQRQFVLGTRNNYAILDTQILISQINNSVSYLYELGKVNAFLLFYHSDISNFPFYIKCFLINLINVKNNQAVLTNAWSYGQLSNYFTQSKQLMNLLFYSDNKSNKDSTNLNKRNTSKEFYVNKYNFWDLCHRLLFFTLYKRLSGVSWIENFISVKKYWRFFNFFKFYSFSKNYPDTIIYCNANNIMSPINESVKLFIPNVTINSHVSNCNGITYLVNSNTKSIIISIFYVILFINSFNIGKLNKKKYLST